MRRTRLVAAACAAGLLAGCGSSTKTPTAPTTTSGNGNATTTSHGPAMATTGAAPGKVGPGASGAYKATNNDVLYHLRIALVRFFINKGFSGVTVHCKGVTDAVASCDVTGNNRVNQQSSAVLTVSVNQSNGVLRITRVST